MQKANDMVYVPGGLNPGSQIIVRGRVLPDETRFAINLKCGEDDDADIALHFNPRRDDGEVVFNSKEGGDWEEEERHPLPSAMQEMVPFEVEILTKSNKFKVSVAGDGGDLRQDKCCLFGWRSSAGHTNSLSPSHRHTHTHNRTHLDTIVHTYTQSYTPTRTPTYHTHLHITHTHTHTHTHIPHTHTHTNTHTHTHIPHTHTHTHTRTHIPHTHTHTHTTHTHTQSHTHTHTQGHTCTHANTHK